MSGNRFEIGDRLPNFLRATESGPEFLYYRDNCGRTLLLAVGADSDKRPDYGPIDVRYLSTEPTGDPDGLTDDGSLIGFLLNGRDADNPHLFWLDANCRLLAVFNEFPSVEQLSVDQPSSQVFTSVAPVLIIPRVFEPEFCTRLIERFESNHQPSGVFREENGETVYVADPDTKIRHEHRITDPTWLGEVESRLLRRVLPEISWAFNFAVTRYEGFKVVRYRASDGGFFTAHRDNDGADTGHRRFALTVNLNPDEYEGGEIRFPEYSQGRYAPPLGSALVFSCSLAHEALTVTRGDRYALVSFFYGDGDELKQAAYRDKVSG